MGRSAGRSGRRWGAAESSAFGGASPAVAARARRARLRVAPPRVPVAHCPLQGAGGRGRARTDPSPAVRGAAAAFRANRGAPSSAPAPAGRREPVRGARAARFLRRRGLGLPARPPLLFRGAPCCPRRGKSQRPPRVCAPRGTRRPKASWDGAWPRAAPPPPPTASRGPPPHPTLCELTGKLTLIAELNINREVRGNLAALPPAGWEGRPANKRRGGN